MPRKTKHNQLTSLKLIKQIHPENAQLRDDFIAYLRSTQRSETTIKSYENDLNIAFVWAIQHLRNTPFPKWKKRDIVALQSWMINTNENSPARVHRIKASLSSLSNFIENVLDDEYPDFRNIIHKVESPALEAVREKTVLSPAIVDKLLMYLTETEQFEKACLVALAISSGRRKSELCRFKVEYFDDKNLICGGALYKTSEKVQTKGRGRGGKRIFCYTLAKKFKPYFDLWMKQREELGIESVWLFPKVGNPEEHIQSTTLNSWALSFGKILDLDFYMHSLRHLWTTELIRAGLPETVIKDLAQWSSLDMVAVYNDCDAEEQFAEYFKDGDIFTAGKKSLVDM